MHFALVLTWVLQKGVNNRAQGSSTENYEEFNMLSVCHLCYPRKYSLGCSVTDCSAAQVAIKNDLLGGGSSAQS